MEHSHYDYCVVGAGPSGLTIAYELLQSHQKVLVVERDSRIGGLAKSHNYDGHIFDTGPKRFHTDDPIVMYFIQHIMDMHRIKRSTKVYFQDKYFEWPLQSKDILRLPIGTAVQCFFDLLKKRKIRDEESFHEYIYSKYGETLYATFFEPYTRKFLRWDPEDIHSDWASTGINRTVIDKRVKANTSFDMLKGLILPDKIETEFLYPSEGGFGGFYEKLLALCQEYDGFHIICNDTVAALEDHGQKFSALTTNGKSLSFDHLIWSGNLNDLVGIVSQTDRKLPYLNTVFYYIICKEAGIGKHRSQWIYVSKGDSLISRITSPKEFAPYTCKDGYYNITCELTDSQTKPVYFHSPERYTQGILDELVSMSFLKDTRFVEDVKINPVVDTYPIYHKRYLKHFAAAAAMVKKFSERIHLLGRCGAFWYNNSDHSIRFAIALSEKLLGYHEQEFDYRGYFGGTFGDGRGGGDRENKN